MAEQGGQHRVSGIPRLGQLQSNADLGNDLILTKNLGVQPAGDLHQMLRGGLSDTGSEKGSERRFRLSCPQAQQPPGIRLGSAGNVHLRPIAGGEQHTSFYAGLTFQPVQQLRDLFSGKGKPFPQRDPGSVAVQAGHLQAHFCPSFTMTREKYPLGLSRSRKSG